MKILLCAGTRPNLVKVAPLYKEAIKQGISADILHTNQHYDYNLSQIFFDQLELPNPKVNLGIKPSSRIRYIKKISQEVKKYLEREKYDFVITVGDVNTTLGCTLGSKLSNTPVAHVEAGLRSHDMRMPEELNRVEVDRLADYKFISEPDGVINLQKDGIFSDKDCFLVGNVVIDNLVNNLENIDKVKLQKELLFEPKSYCLVTLHRPSNVDSKIRLKKILEVINKYSTCIKIVFPLHPRTKANIERYGYKDLISNLVVTEPLGYFEFLNLMKNSKFVITDSGGAQEESTYFKVPCITVRANTERPITMINGTSYLSGEDTLLLDYYTRLAIEDRLKGRNQIYELWDGKASERIIEILKSKCNI